MHNPFSLDGKTILITGASSGIGRAVAIESSKMGAKLFITGRCKGRLNETFIALEGIGHQQFVADLTSLYKTDELSTYIDLNRPSNSIIQERPAYTNISNGIGIFSCRHTKKYSYNLASYSIDSLLHSKYTGNLGFH